jgi:tight adherence protein C
MALIIVLGSFLFLAFLVLFFFMLPVSSAQSALLDEVTRRASQPDEGTRHTLLNADLVAKPFLLIRRLGAAEPGPQLVRRLVLAGYRKPAHADIYLGARLAIPALAGLAVALLVTQNTFLFFMMAVVLGFFVPDFWLSRAIQKRRDKIKLSLPDGLDMLAVCMEAGLGLDQSIVRIGNEFGLSHPELSEEFLQVNFEQRAGIPRLAAWKSFADRVNIESARSFVAMLIQTDRFGTPISKSLGAFSDALRTQRRQQAEEMAAKTTIKLVPPLVFFIFPSMGIVTVGPAAITVMRNMAHLAGN